MSPTEIFSSHALREFQFLTDDFEFIRDASVGPDDCGEFRHRYRNGDWFVYLVFNTYERSVDIEFGNADHIDKPFSFHLYLSLVDPTRHYELGHAIANTDPDIGPLVQLYADSLKRSGTAILMRDKRVCQQMAHAMIRGEGMCPSYGEQPEGSRIVSRFE